MTIKKKLFVALLFICAMLVVVVVSGCNHTDAQSDSKVGPTIKDVSKYCSYGWFDNHEYVIYRVPNGNGCDFGFTHSPNCPCLTNRLETLR